MSKKTLYVLGMLLTIIITTILQWKYCCSCNSTCEKNKSTDNVVVTPEVKEATKFPFAIKDADGNLSLTANDNFNFKRSEFNFMNPVSSDVDANIDKLKDYVSENNGKSFLITGYYAKNEENNSLFPNLGYARANAVKNYFVTKGIPSKIIDTYGELKEGLLPDSLNVFYGPLAFGLKNQSEGEKAKISELKKSIQDNPLVLHFKTGETRINLSKEQRMKMIDISHYLDKVEDAVCLVTGHTDNTGSASQNMIYGQQRADFAKEQLVKNGIAADKINTSSKGQKQPIADNKTEEGKAKNRRTVITIK